MHYVITQYAHVEIVEIAVSVYCGNLRNDWAISMSDTNFIVSRLGKFTKTFIKAKIIYKNLMIMR